MTSTLYGLKLGNHQTVKFGFEMIVMRTSRTSVLHGYRSEIFGAAIRGRLSRLERMISARK